MLLTGGRVICPAGNLDAVMDVAVKDGRIAAVEAGIRAEARETIDCAGLIVTPGLVDSHAHIYTSSHNSMPPDDAGVFAGATTVVDGGSAGYMTFADFRAREAATKEKMSAMGTIITVRVILTRVAVGTDAASKANEVAMTDEVSLTAVPAHTPNVAASSPNQCPSAGKMTTAARLKRKTTEME